MSCRHQSEFESACRPCDKSRAQYEQSSGPHTRLFARCCPISNRPPKTDRPRAPMAMRSGFHWSAFRIRAHAGESASASELICQSGNIDRICSLARSAKPCASSQRMPRPFVRTLHGWHVQGKGVVSFFVDRRRDEDVSDGHNHTPASVLRPARFKSSSAVSALSEPSYATRIFILSVTTLLSPDVSIPHGLIATFITPSSRSANRS